MKPGDFSCSPYALIRSGVCAIYDPYKDYLEQNKTVKDRSRQMLDKFTKDMLKPGMLVECRDGGLRKLGYCSSLELSTLSRENGLWINFNNFNNDLTSTYFGDYDVLKVYKPIQTEDSFSFDLSHHKLIWERPEPKISLTHDEIAEKLGIKPESLVIVANGMKYGYGCWTKE